MPLRGDAATPGLRKHNARHPSRNLKLPGTARPSDRLVATGRARYVRSRSRVVLEWRTKGAWAHVAKGGLKNSRFKIAFAVPADAQAGVWKLRARVVHGKRTVAVA